MNRQLLLLLAVIACCRPTRLWADTEIHVETAGTLQSLLPSSDKNLKVTGFINGSDIKYVRQLVAAGTVTSLDWSGVRIVKGGEAYFETFTTENDIIGEKMFYQCSKLQAMVLPSAATSVRKNAFANTGLRKIDIPASVLSIGEDAFAYCNSLATVVIGKKVKSLSKGVFYGSNVSKAYVKPMTPPAAPSYLFSSKPTVYVYKEALADYKASDWKEFYGSIYGSLANFYPQEPDENDLARELCSVYFEDAACTQLKAEYQAMTDEELTQTMVEGGSPAFIISIALKIKNQSWAAYEQEFRIHSYKAYSDAKYWHDKLLIECGSYMGNPTGIYTKNDGDPLYVFVDDDVPSDATLYIASLGVDKMCTNAKTGQKLQKGLNVIDGEANSLLYILYTADTKSMTRRLEEWPEMKIHIEGGILEGYYDASRHTDADYKKLLKGVTSETFVIKGRHSVMNLRTSLLRETFPNKIHKASECMDSLYVWENDLIGINESVAKGEKAGAPWYLTGGEAYYPGYFNNPVYVDNDSPGSYAHANTYGTHFSLGASKFCLNPYISDYDEGGTSHEIGHLHQKAIKIEGTEEGSNDLFALVNFFLTGHRASTGRPLSVTMEEFARHEPFYWRGPDRGFLRMYYTLYLYYHQAQKNTSFYPELFKALRKDKISIYGTSTYNSGLKFVRKVCEVAQEDLTDFFYVYGFFEPSTNRYLEAYGDHWVTNKLADINRTKAAIAQYPVKNREIIFIEDRVDYVPTTGFVTTAGQHRKYRSEEQVGMCGDVGQYTDYLPGACEPSEYVYYRSDSLYALEGKGGLGFLLLDEEGNLQYAANAKNFCIPSSILNCQLSIVNYQLVSLDSDGSLHEIPYAGSGAETVELPMAGRLQQTLENEQVIKLTVKGKIHGKDIKYMRQLIAENNLQSIDLEQAQIIANSSYSYYQSYKTAKDVLGDYAFQGFGKLISVKLPLTITKIGSFAFSRSGLKTVIIPDKVTAISGDAFSYCDRLSTVLIGKGVRTMGQGVFYSTPVKDAYLLPLTPPNLTGTSDYLFTSKPVIHVFASALDAYKAAGWERFGTLVGDLTDDIIDSIDTPTPFSGSNGQWSTAGGQSVYDLSGRKVNSKLSTDFQLSTLNSQLKRGIYIVNGKKILR